MHSYNDIRNVAVIAHVDHGKTTLVDALLKQTHSFRDNQAEMSQERIMDSNDLEREKGITILSKNTSVFYKDTKINIIDTPGHADFGGEVERILNMADGALLIVDAAEGPLSQTKFVLRKALAAGLKIILVINKIDRKDANVKKILADCEELFLSSVTDPELLNFPVIYAVGKDGKTWNTMPEDLASKSDTTALFEAIMSYIPTSQKNIDQPFSMLVSAFEKNAYLGKLAVGRVYSGVLKKGESMNLLDPVKGKVGQFRSEKMYVNEAVNKVEVDEVKSGEIVYLAGVDELKIGQTIASPKVEKALPTIMITEPTLKSSFGPNTSIYAKAESRFLTSRELKARLYEYAETDLGLRVAEDTEDSIRLIVSGRGELHLAILIENLRREGYAMEVGKPEVILKTIDGVVCEPFNELTILSNEEYMGAITAELGKRKAQMLDMVAENGNVRMVYKISERNALGLRSVMMTQTRGSISLSYLFIAFEPKVETTAHSRNGVIIASETGKALSYGLDIAKDRGILFVNPNENIYEGQIVGERPLEGDLEMNVCKGKQLTNMRSAGNDDNISLPPALKYSIEESLDFIEADELVDVTPENIRLRKKLLNKGDREKASKKNK